MFPSSGMHPPDAESAESRPRNRRSNVAANATSSSSTSTSLTGGLLSPTSASRPYSSFNADPRNGSPSRRDTSGSSGFGGFGSGLLSPTASSWVPNWSSIQDFATTLIAGNGTSGGGSGSASRSRTVSGRSSQTHAGSSSRKLPDTWGPAPPGESTAFSSSRPRLHDVAAGQVAARERELKARKTASVLESHTNVNGGLDVRGKYKMRTSDEIVRGPATDASQEVEDCLAFIHRVQATDTYFGIILKYRCNEDTFRKANGLWTRDSIQIRKWVALPVDACEMKGRPCDDPSLFPQGVDLLASTPTATTTTSSDYFGATSGKAASTGTGTPTKAATEDGSAEPPWTHVRWVRLDSCPDPVEIVRMSRKALSYFPPRRKKSIRSSMSSLSTPRASLDMALSNTSLPDRAAADGSPNRGSRRSSLLGNNRIPLGTSPLSSSSPPRLRSGLGKTSAPVDPRPEWMRRPGGVGSMSKSVRAPGPARDSLNKWTTKHIPGFNIESLPSMSVMGSETAHFGFGEESPGLVESSFEDGRDASSMAAAAAKDTGFDKAAASIETWLRGAFKGTAGGSTATDSPSTSFAARIGRQLEETLGDLIELEDGRTNTDDDAGGGGSSSANQNTRLATGGTVTQSAGRDGVVRGRSTATGSRTAPPGNMAKGKKSD